MRDRLTPFGLKCREFRTRYNLVMKDQAKGLGLTVAYISAIELGKRPIPPEYPAELSHWMSLSAEDTQLLDELADGHRRIARIIPKNAEQAKLVEDLAKNIDNLSKEGLEYLRVSLAVSKSVGTSHFEVRKRAMLASAIFNLDQRTTFDVLRIVENQLYLVDANFFLKIETDRSGQPPLYSESDGRRVDQIVSSAWFYNEASQQTPASRFKLAHEIAHWVLHPQENHAYSRSPKTNYILSKRYLRIESQADIFAREFLLPISVVDRFETSEALARAANVPAWVAQKRLRELQELGAQERYNLRLYEKEIRDIVAPRKLRGGLERTLFGKELKDIRKSETVQTTKASRVFRRRTNARSIDLFDYGNLQERGETRSDDWFRRYGYRG